MYLERLGYAYLLIALITFFLLTRMNYFRTQLQKC